MVSLHISTVHYPGSEYIRNGVYVNGVGEGASIVFSRDVQCQGIRFQTIVFVTFYRRRKLKYSLSRGAGILISISHVQLQFNNGLQSKPRLYFCLYLLPSDQFKNVAPEI